VLLDLYNLEIKTIEIIKNISLQVHGPMARINTSASIGS
jgi:hypothetical protein